jgi:hypothetical protein
MFNDTAAPPHRRKRRREAPAISTFLFALPITMTQWATVPKRPPPFAWWMSDNRIAAVIRSCIPVHIEWFDAWKSEITAVRFYKQSCDHFHPQIFIAPTEYGAYDF